MSTEEKMTVDERRKYLRLMKKRYVKANRKERGRLLDEMEAVIGIHRKSLIRLMSGDLERQPRCRQRKETYGPEVDDALRVVDESLNYICAERLTPNLVWITTHLAAHGEIEAPPSLLEQFERISVSTVKRRLNRVRQDQPRLPRRKGPARTNKLTRDIPMWYACPGTRNNLATSRCIWFIILAPLLLASMHAHCKWLTSPPPGANGPLCWDEVTW